MAAREARRQAVAEQGRAVAAAVAEAEGRARAAEDAAEARAARAVAAAEAMEQEQAGLREQAAAWKKKTLKKVVKKNL